MVNRERNPVPGWDVNGCGMTLFRKSVLLIFAKFFAGNRSRLTSEF